MAFQNGDILIAIDETIEDHEDDFGPFATIDLSARIDLEMAKSKPTRIAVREERRKKQFLRKERRRSKVLQAFANRPKSVHKIRWGVHEDEAVDVSCVERAVDRLATSTKTDRSTVEMRLFCIVAFVILIGIVGLGFRVAYFNDLI